MKITFMDIHIVENILLLSKTEFLESYEATELEYDQAVKELVVIIKRWLNGYIQI